MEKNDCAEKLFYCWPDPFTVLYLYQPVREIGEGSGVGANSGGGGHGVHTMAGNGDNHEGMQKMLQLT